MSYTLTETGEALTETQDGVTMPADYSFAAVNDFVHRHDTHYEELQCLCLGMACRIEKLERKPDTCRKCGGEMRAGVAMGQTLTGVPDFAGDGHVCTVSPGGSGKVIDCMKCVDCGWSVTK